MTYSIFDHAQLGHVVPQPNTPTVTPPAPSPAVEPQPMEPSVIPQSPTPQPLERKHGYRTKPAQKGWAVAIGLGLFEKPEDTRDWRYNPTD